MRKLNILFLLTAGIFSARAEDFVALKNENATKANVAKITLSEKFEPSENPAETVESQDIVSNGTAEVIHPETTAPTVQAEKTNGSPDNDADGKNKKTLPINISYFGETLVHPGMEIGYENNFFRSFFYTASIGVYFHQRNHTGLFLSGGLNWRHTFSFGYSPEFGIALGYLHTWEAGGPTYIVDKDGKVSQKTKWGRPHVMPSIKLGLLGWDLRKKTNIPLRINADVIVFGRYPFNNLMLPHFALKIGATYYFAL
ncbi:MAG: hypothetical protein FWG75_06525 [Cystobacterineae bacterium]|nr:hypothetical protein [Cystobacterineae bacterium]